MKSQRQLQYGETVKRIIADIFLRGDVVNFSSGYVTILEADVSPDMKNVKIFIDIFPDHKNQKEIIKKLNDAAPHFRFQMAKKLASKSTPQLTFILDETGKNVANIENLIADESKKIK